MEWETEPLEVKTTEAELPVTNIHNKQYMPISYLYAALAENNQYAPLAENNKDNDNCKGVEDEITRVDSDGESTGVKS